MYICILLRRDLSPAMIKNNLRSRLCLDFDRYYKMAHTIDDILIFARALILSSLYVFFLVLALIDPR